MDMKFDLNKAREYMSMMADGRNPVTKEYVLMDDTVYYDEVQNCCKYILTYIDKMIAEKGETNRIKSIRIYPYQVEMRQLIRMINNNFDRQSDNKITTRQFKRWLQVIGAVRIDKVHSKETIQLTGFSEAFGVSLMHGDSTKRPKLLFNTNAQEYINDHLHEIIGYCGS